MKQSRNSAFHVDVDHCSTTKAVESWRALNPSRVACAPEIPVQHWLSAERRYIVIGMGQVPCVMRGEQEKGAH